MFDEESGCGFIRAISPLGRPPVQLQALKVLGLVICLSNVQDIEFSVLVICSQYFVRENDYLDLIDDTQLINHSIMLCDTMQKWILEKYRIYSLNEEGQSQIIDAELSSLGYPFPKTLLCESDLEGSSK